MPLDNLPTYDELTDLILESERAGDFEASRILVDMLDAGEYQKEGGAASALLQGVGQGATFGFSDELGAGARVLGESIMGPAMAAIGVGDYKPTEGEDTFWNRLTDYAQQHTIWGDKTAGEAYQENLASQRRALDVARRENPLTTMAGELAGGLASGGVGLGRAVAGRAAMAGVGQAAKVGTGMGALAGYGYSESDPIIEGLKLALDPQDRTPENIANAKQELMGAGLDTALGAGLGALSAPIMAGLGAGLKTVGRVVSRPFTRNAQIREAARKEIAEAISKDIDDGVLTLEQAQQELDAIGGWVGDLGENTQRLVERTVQQDTPASRALERLLRQRNREEYKRLIPRLTALLDPESKSNSWSMAGVQFRLLNQKRANAQRAYDAVRGVPHTLTDAERSFMTSPYSRTAIKTANGIRAAGQLDDLSKNLDNVSSMTYDELDAFVRGWDEQLSRWYGSSNNSNKALATAWKPRFEAFKESLYAASPDYAAARRQWSNDSALEEALKQGTRLFQDGAELNTMLLENMNPAERMHFRLGALQSMAQRIMNATFDSSAASKILNTPAKQEAISVAFENPREFQNFMQWATGEITKYQTFAKAGLNSATTRRVMQQMADPAKDAAGLFGYATAQELGLGLAGMNMMRRLAQAGARALGAPDPRVAMNMRNQAMTDMLTTPGGQLGGLLNTPRNTLSERAFANIMEPSSPISAGLAGGLLAGDIYPDIY